MEHILGTAVVLSSGMGSGCPNACSGTWRAWAGSWINSLPRNAKAAKGMLTYDGLLFSRGYTITGCLSEPKEL